MPFAYTHSFDCPARSGGLHDPALCAAAVPAGRELAGVEIDASAPVQHCQVCGALIWFGFTRAGRRNPFDVVDGARTAVTHFSTCPNVRTFTSSRRRVS